MSQSSSQYIEFDTPRLHLRPTSEADAPFIIELFNTPKWILYVGDRNVHTEAEAQAYVRNRMQPQLERLGYGNYTVFLKENDEPIGTCGLYDRSGLEGVDIGFAFLPQYEGKGYAFESCQCLMNAAKDKFGIRELKGITLEENHASRRLMEKLGMICEGKIRIEGDPEELLLYKITL